MSFTISDTELAKIIQDASLKAARQAAETAVAELMAKQNGTSAEAPFTGDWINKNPQAIPMIVEEFNLANVHYEVKISYHWDLGNGWENQ